MSNSLPAENAFRDDYECPECRSHLKYTATPVPGYFMVRVIHEPGCPRVNGDLPL